MTSFVLVPGAASTGWYWHLVAERLRDAGYEVATPDLPSGDDDAGLAEYARVIAEAVDEVGRPVSVVAQSMAGLSVPLVAELRPIDEIVLVAALIPAPGETGHEWWVNTDQPDAQRLAAIMGARDPDAEFDPVELFLHDVPRELAMESGRQMVPQSPRPFDDPWPLDRWPDVPTRVLACEDDRLFPFFFMRRISEERLGIEPDVIPGGHLPALHSPDRLARYLMGLGTDHEVPGV